MTVPNVPVDRIGGQARKTDYKHVFLIIVAGLLYMAGWMPGRMWLGVRIVAVWAVHTWAGSALRVGFADGCKPPKLGR